MGKLPYMQFFPSDWLGHAGVRMCSIEARGLWIDMLCMLHQSCRRGYLLDESGTPIDVERLARVCGLATERVSACLQELSRVGAYSCDSAGVIYSRRMVREDQKRSTTARRASESRALEVRPRLGDGSCSSDSGSEIGEEGEGSGEGECAASNVGCNGVPASIDSPRFRDLWGDYLRHRREAHKPATPTAQRRQLAKLEKWGLARAIAALEHTLEHGWQGIFEPDGAQAEDADDEAAQPWYDRRDAELTDEERKARSEWLLRKAIGE